MCILSLKLLLLLLLLFSNVQCTCTFYSALTLDGHITRKNCYNKLTIPKKKVSTEITLVRQKSNNDDYSQKINQ